ncbi:MAG: hypothetical protein ACLSDQ_02720 [Adlercreutzia equolifaciens]
MVGRRMRFPSRHGARERPHRRGDGGGAARGQRDGWQASPVPVAPETNSTSPPPPPSSS